MKKFVPAALGMLLVPLFCSGAYMCLPRMSEPWESIASYIAFGLSVLAGIGCVFLLPLPKWARVVVSVVYVPFIYWLLIWEWLILAGLIWGEFP